MEFGFQTGVAFGMLCIVVVYLANRFIVKPIQRSKNQDKKDCGPDCGCS